jgi:hypothetical protein
MICLYWYIYICPLFYLHYLDISPLVFFIRLSHNLPVYFVLLCNCSVLYVVSVVSVKNERKKHQKQQQKTRTSNQRSIALDASTLYPIRFYIFFIFLCKTEKSINRLFYGCVLKRYFVFSPRKTAGRIY